MQSQDSGPTSLGRNISLLNWASILHTVPARASRKNHEPAPAASGGLPGGVWAEPRAGAADEQMTCLLPNLGFSQLPTPDKKTPCAEARPWAFSSLVERRNGPVKANGPFLFSLNGWKGFTFLFFLPVDDADNKGGFSEQVCVVCDRVSPAGGRQLDNGAPLGEGLRAVFSAPRSSWAEPLIGTYCPINEFSLQRFI